jgi:hypothetical protein
VFSSACGVVYKKPKNTKADRARYYLDQLNEKNKQAKSLEEKLNRIFKDRVISEINSKLSPLFLFDPLRLETRFVNNPVTMDGALLDEIIEEALEGSAETSALSLSLAEDYKLDESEERSYLQGIFLNEKDKPEQNSVRSCLYDNFTRPGFSLVSDYEYCIQSKFSRLEYWYYKYRMEAIYMSAEVRKSYFTKLEKVYNSNETQKCIKDKPSKACLMLFKNKLVSLKLSHFSDEVKQVD